MSLSDLDRLRMFDNSNPPGGLYSMCEPSEDVMSEWIVRDESSRELEALDLGL